MVLILALVVTISIEIGIGVLQSPAFGLGAGIGKITLVENWYWNYYWKSISNTIGIGTAIVKMISNTIGIGIGGKILVLIISELWYFFKACRNVCTGKRFLEIHSTSFQVLVCIEQRKYAWRIIF